MAADKETTKKKDTAKKKATPKKKFVEKKVTKPVEEKSEPVVEEKVLNEMNADELYPKNVLEVEEQTEVEDEKLEVMNGDPAVLTPNEEESKRVKEIFKEVINEKPKVVEKEEKGVKKIIKRINRSFGYLWNGQMIDF